MGSLIYLVVCLPACLLFLFVFAACLPLSLEKKNEIKHNITLFGAFNKLFLKSSHAAKSADKTERGGVIETWIL